MFYSFYGDFCSTTEQHIIVSYLSRNVIASDRQLNSEIVLLLSNSHEARLLMESITPESGTINDIQRRAESEGATVLTEDTMGLEHTLEDMDDQERVRMFHWVRNTFENCWRKHPLKDELYLRALVFESALRDISPPPFGGNDEANGTDTSDLNKSQFESSIDTPHADPTLFERVQAFHKGGRHLFDELTSKGTSVTTMKQYRIFMKCKAAQRRHNLSNDDCDRLIHKALQKLLPEIVQPPPDCERWPLWWELDKAGFLEWKKEQRAKATELDANKTTPRA